MIDHKQAPAEDWIAAVRARYPTERTVDEALTRKLRARAGPPYAPTPPGEIECGLAAFFADKAPGASVGDIRPLGGGASKEQFVFTLSEGDSRATYVLRREPPESVVETHRGREYELMRAMAGVVPVPEVPWVDPEGVWFGRPSLISRFVSGVTKPPESHSNVTGLGSGFSPEWQARLGPQFVDLMAAIHRFDWQGAELGAFDAPPVGSTAGVHSVINWWERVWEEDSFEPLPLVRYVAQWLRAHAPPIGRVTVVHHDYRAGNFLFDPTSGEVTAVLDWELAHLGDYHEDIAWSFQEGYGYHDAAGRFIVCGLIEREEFLRRYAERTGFVIDRDKLAYYGVMNCWKSTVMVLGTAVRCMIGGKSHQDILLSWLAGFGQTCVVNLLTLLKEAERGS